MSNPEMSNILLNYFDGLMSEEERLAFEKELAASPDLQQELDHFKLAKRGLEHYGLRADVKAIHEEMMRSLSTENTLMKVRKNHFVSPLFKLAASIFVVFLLAIFYKFISVSPDKLYREQFVAYSVDTERGSADASAMELDYRAGAYEKVIKQFLQEKNPGTKEKFLTGQAYLALKQAPQAAALFGALREQSDGGDPFGDDAEYYLALSYLAMRQVSKALPLFEKIYRDEQHVYHDQVSLQTLLDLKMLNLKNKF